MAIELNIVICDGESNINKAYSEITLSSEYSELDGKELDSVLPHILSTYRLPNGDMLTMTVEKKTVFRPYPYPTLIIMLSERRASGKQCPGKTFMNVVALIIKDIFLRYGDKRLPEILIHAYGQYDKGLAGYSKIVE